LLIEVGDIAALADIVFGERLGQRMILFSEPEEAANGHDGVCDFAARLIASKVRSGSSGRKLGESSRI
jgi:hypothetical protein